MYRLYWISEDGQGSVDCGEYATYSEAESAIPSQEKILFEQALQDGPGQDGLMTKSAVLDGDFEVKRV